MRQATWLRIISQHISPSWFHNEPGAMVEFSQEEIISCLQQSFRHEQAAARICWALADKAVEPHTAVLFKGMAMAEKRQVIRGTRELALLSVPILHDDTWLEKVWRWCLVRLGPHQALKWIRFVKRRDIHRLNALRQSVMKLPMQKKNK
jgi:hypothetical protein